MHYVTKPWLKRKHTSMTLVFQKKSTRICIKFATRVSLLFDFEVWKTPRFNLACMR